MGNVLLAAAISTKGYEGQSFWDIAPMKRKIAAIFAADIAGYSRLVAEDEEETLRRLAAYREVVDDFIARAGGRIFNTAGDAVLAEFSSAVEAVRCAIDIQESLRTRNMAFPLSRHMSFRIGITIGDVVERGGDLLGDGVNIAARLEGLAEVGGICVSRAVHEQVANKLSVEFADLGAQEVKNIPTPVHVYRVAMPGEAGAGGKRVNGPRPAPKGSAVGHGWAWPLAATLICFAVTGTVAFMYFENIKVTVAPVAGSAAKPPGSPAEETRAAPATVPIPVPIPPAAPAARPPEQPGSAFATLSPRPPRAEPRPPAPSSAAPAPVCDEIAGEVNESETIHTGPTLKKNIFFIDATPGCRITSVKPEVVSQMNFSNLKITILEKGRKARGNFDLLTNASSTAMVKLKFRALQESAVD